MTPIARAASIDAAQRKRLRAADMRAFRRLQAARRCGDPIAAAAAEVEREMVLSHIRQTASAAECRR